MTEAVPAVPLQLMLTGARHGYTVKRTADRSAYLITGDDAAYTERLATLAMVQVLLSMLPPLGRAS